MSIGHHLCQAFTESGDRLDQVGVGGGVRHPVFVQRSPDDADAPFDWHPPVRLTVLTNFLLVLFPNLFSLEEMFIEK